MKLSPEIQLEVDHLLNPTEITYASSILALKIPIDPVIDIIVSELKEKVHRIRCKVYPHRISLYDRRCCDPQRDNDEKYAIDSIEDGKIILSDSTPDIIDCVAYDNNIIGEYSIVSPDPNIDPEDELNKLITTISRLLTQHGTY